MEEIKLKREEARLIMELLERDLNRFHESDLKLSAREYQMRRELYIAMVDIAYESKEP